MQTLQRELQALYVTWQDQTTKRYHSVGRLVSGLSPDKPDFEFCYLGGVNGAIKAGFQTFLSFEDVNVVYRSDTLFPMFQNRLMPPGRAEYRQFLQSLAIDAENPDPMSILIHSGGGRATDSLEMFAVPKLLTKGLPYKTHFLAHGIRYLLPVSLDRIERLKADERLYFMHDCQNAADPYALALRTEDRMIVGYMPRYMLGDAFKLLGSCQKVELYVARVNSEPHAPLQQRLLCRLEACWPQDFAAFDSDEYRPICSDAADLTHWNRWS
jgi:hypothetical protein